MNLDINTLFLVTIYVEAILGLLLLFAWVQNAQITAVAWWGCAHLLRAGSVVLFGMYGNVSDAISIDLANAILLLSFAITWTGARVFDGRSPLPMYMLAGPVAWLIVAHLPSFSEIEIRVLVASGIVTTYTWLAAYEFWRGRNEPLVSRWPAIFMLFAHGSLFLLRTPLAAVLPWTAADSDVFDSVWLTVLSFEALLFTIAIAFIFLAMAKERTEYRHKTAAMVDPLTGIANRRSFLHEGIELMKRHAGDARPAAVLLIDLDHFKSINDRFGHAIGRSRAAGLCRSGNGGIARLRSGRTARRRGICGRALRCWTREGTSARRANTRVVCRGGCRSGWTAGRRDAEHRRGGQRGSAAECARAPAAGRPGAVSRQGARPDRVELATLDLVLPGKDAASAQLAPRTAA
jgi:Diguanylate cyclase, GGDEF domain